MEEYRSEKNRLSEAQLQTLSPSALAYLGDAVYELFVRSALIAPPNRPRDYHRKVVSQVRAEKQAQHLQTLLEHLTEAERDVLRRGRNASTRGPRRIDAVIYQQATSLEALLGYLYLRDLERLAELLRYIDLSESWS